MATVAYYDTLSHNLLLKYRLMSGLDDKLLWATKQVEKQNSRREVSRSIPTLSCG
jgi:hypothetical protein